MSEIKILLDRLPKEQKDQLMYAFEHGFTQIVITQETSFIAVNLSGMDNVEIEMEQGAWTIGRIKHG